MFKLKIFSLANVILNHKLFQKFKIINDEFNYLINILANKTFQPFLKKLKKKKSLYFLR